MVEFAAAMMLFILIWFFLGSRFDDRLAADSRVSMAESMRLKSDYVLGSLVEGRGIPGSWPGMPLSDINMVGLAVTDRDISEAKLAAFKAFSQPLGYNALREKLGIGEYDFYFELEGVADAFAGNKISGPATKVVARRVVYYNGNAEIAELTLYMEER